MLISANRQFKVLLAKYICSNFSKFPQKITSVKWTEKQQREALELKSTKGDIST